MGELADIGNVWTLGGVLGILYLLLRVISYVARSRLAVYGHHERPDCDTDCPGLVQGIFVVQNTEDVPVENGLRIEIEVDQIASDLREPLIVRSGVSEKLAVMTLDGPKRLVIECPRMPALDIWPIEFRTTASPENIWVSVESRHKSRFWFSEIHPARRSLADCSGLAFPRSEPPWPAGVAAIGAAGLIYLFPILNRETSLVLTKGLFTEFRWALDGTILTLLVGLSLLVFTYCRRSPPPVILGYLGRANGEES